MSSYNLSITSRVTSDSLGHIRSKNLIPGVLYGRGAESIMVAISATEFEKVYAQAGGNSLVELTSDGGEPVTALIYDVQRHPVTETVLHVDLYRVRMDEKIYADINLVFIGEAPAVKLLAGILVKQTELLEVVCLPRDLVHEIKVDLSVLDGFDKIIHAEDVALPEGLALAGDPKQVIVQVTAPSVAEEEKAAEGAATETATEVSKDAHAETTQGGETKKA
ncbi:MAG: 50S ribosomal protein L25 [Parcubacteria group bacterium CG_4_8_14_3_um_filter_48_16]|nr:MAG: hypothetical protein AUK21_02070 [Parcubacteria group bacterium CG2_30_48_51]PIW79192.1 MAG: 50S ribosomal protein L25 [Parcubacteria group bacterium CG_4_8_14_3_um_filter_48_16]PIY77878.1 MAG: 50S ribosomal protein L25 [Parcubacteria group bacterium CG_4_10_14_0_8_um_filter_48_154]PIZ77313.1 MAG: 50S ribosomal protein L25 [bacterium CG_4_10_14_0_2_um_filter_48_144]PJC39497.1 MAG: 50S ribosomal protein L25 [Parcubacteria group bacterium CG_4_9_14_0_2_um_filter_48_40]